MWKDGGFRTVEQSRDPLPNRLGAFTGKAKTLPVEKQRGFGILHQWLVVRRERYLLTGHINAGVRRMESPKRQDDGHVGDPLSVTGAAL
jgi:hypothetical protein